ARSPEPSTPLPETRPLAVRCSACPHRGTPRPALSLPVTHARTNGWVDRPFHTTDQRSVNLAAWPEPHSTKARNRKRATGRPGGHRHRPGRPPPPVRGRHRRREPSAPGPPGPADAVRMAHRAAARGRSRTPRGTAWDRVPPPAGPVPAGGAGRPARAAQAAGGTTRTCDAPPRDVRGGAFVLCHAREPSPAGREARPRPGRCHREMPGAGNLAVSSVTSPRTRAITSSASPFATAVMTSSIHAPIWRISGSRIPREVTAGVP